MDSKLKSKGLMIQGTASSVGKSILCTALCRIFKQDGYNVNPFKSQNMSLNSYITPEGHEMGRAQVMQAEAGGKVPSASMNPILLKPTSDRKSQVIIKGKVYKNMDAVEYFAFKPSLRNEITNIYNDLSNSSDVVVIEGAGSPAEINLKREDIVNMGMAKIAKAPVILVGDIDKGGVFASLAGTMLLLDEEERKMVKGVIINKFRGSIEILEPGLKMLEEIIKVPVIGVIPYFRLNIEDEDSVSEWLQDNNGEKKEVDVAIIRLPYMSNHTDFNSLKLHEDIGVRFVSKSSQLGNPDLIIIPGTKSTIKDMEWLRSEGLENKIKECHRKGSYIFGICGGYQMLGETIVDFHAVETNQKSVEGLCLLNQYTEFQEEKTTTLVEGYDNLFNQKIRGYEIHMGHTKKAEDIRNFATIDSIDLMTSKYDGGMNEDKTVIGTYIHGIFDSSDFTRSYINMIRESKGLLAIEATVKNYWEYKDEQYEELAKIVRDNMDMKKLYSILEEGLND